MAGRTGPLRWIEGRGWTRALGPLFMLAAAWLALELFFVRSSGSLDSGVIVLGLAVYLGWTIWAADRPFTDRIIVFGIIVSSAVAIALFLAGLSLRATLASWLSFVLGVPWSRSWSNWF